MPAGTKLWRYEYRLEGRKQKFSYGNYPEISLADIEAPMLRELLYEIRERRGAQSALYAHGWAFRVFAYALEAGT